MATEISDITSKVTLENQFSKEADKVVDSLEKMDGANKKVEESFQKSGHSIETYADGIKKYGKAYDSMLDAMLRFDRKQKESAEMQKEFGSAWKAAQDAKEKYAKSSDSLTPSLLGLATAVGAGKLAVDAFVVSIKLLYEETIKAIKLFPEMAIEGSRISSIASNFDHLTESVGKVGKELMGALREGTHRTVDDLTLMTMVNKNLAAGLDLTSAQYKTMSTAAQALAQAEGINVVQALERVNRALLTGQTQGLNQLTGRINLIAAEEKFAKSLDTTREHLNEEGRTQAHRLGIIDAMADAQQRLGVQTDGVGDMVDQVSTLWTNFVTKLQQTIAESPAVVAAFTGIRDAITAIFDNNQQKVITLINDSIKSIGVVLIDVAEIAVRVAIVIGHELAGLLIRINEFRLGVMGAESAYLNFKAGNAENAAKSKEIQDLNKQISILAASTLQLLDLRDNAPAMSEAVIGQLEIIKGKMLNAGKEAGQLYGTGFGGVVLSPPVLGGQLNKGVLGGVLSTGTGAAAAAGESDKDKYTKTIPAELNKIENATEAALKRTQALWDEHAKLVDKSNKFAYTSAVNDADRAFEREKTELENRYKETAKFYKDQKALKTLHDKEMEALEALHQQRLEDALKAEKERIRLIEASHTGMGKNAGESTIAANLPDQKLPLFTFLAAKQWQGQMADIETSASHAEKAITASMNKAAKSVVPLTEEQKKLIARMKELGYTSEQIGAVMERSFDKPHAALSSFSDTLGAMSEAFSQLAQVSDGSFGRVLKVTSQVMTSANVAVKAYENLSSAIEEGTANIGTYAVAWGSWIGLVIQGAMMLSEWLSKDAKLAEELFNYKVSSGTVDVMNALTNATLGYAKALNDAIMNAKTLAEAQDAVKKAQAALDLATEAGQKYGPSEGDLITQWRHAKELYDFMLKSGVYTADQLKAAWEEVEKARKRVGDVPTKTGEPVSSPEEKRRQEMEDAAKDAGYVTQEELEKAADKAEKLAEYMRDSGKYTAEQVEDAFKKAQDAADKALGINTEAIKKLKAEYDTLNKQVEGEAAEADMGVNEKRARERMAQIEQEMKAEQDRIDAIRQKSAEETAKVTGEATGKAVGDALKDVFTGADKWQTFYGDDFHKNTDDAVAYTTDQFDSAAKDVQDKFDGIEIRIPIHFDYDDVVMPNGLRPGEQPEPMALGGVGHADGPMSFTTQGNEDFAFSGEGKSFSDMSGGGSKGPYTIQINVGGTMVKEVVMDELEATPTSRDVKVFSGLSRAAGRR